MGGPAMDFGVYGSRSALRSRIHCLDGILRGNAVQHRCAEAWDAGHSFLRGGNGASDFYLRTGVDLLFVWNLQKICKEKPGRQKSLRGD